MKSKPMATDPLRRGTDTAQDIGTYGGLCNRTACRAPGAYYWNESTRKHYCQKCGELINREAAKFGEPPLCRLFGPVGGIENKE